MKKQVYLFLSFIVISCACFTAPHNRRYMIEIVKPTEDTLYLVTETPFYRWPEIDDKLPMQEFHRWSRPRQAYEEWVIYSISDYTRQDEWRQFKLFLNKLEENGIKSELAYVEDSYIILYLSKCDVLYKPNIF